MTELARAREPIFIAGVAVEIEQRVSAPPRADKPQRFPGGGCIWMQEQDVCRPAAPAKAPAAGRFFTSTGTEPE